MSVSPFIGGVEGNTTFFECPNNSYITDVYGRAGHWVDGIKFKCSDGTMSPHYGGSGGGSFTWNSPSGFTGTGDSSVWGYVYGLQLVKADGIKTPMGGNMNGTAIPPWKCPPNEKIYAVSTQSDQFLNGIRFYCMPVVKPPAVVPTTVPTSVPTAVIKPPIVTIKTPTVIPTVVAASPSGNYTEQDDINYITFILLFLFIVLIIVAMILLYNPKINNNQNNQSNK